LRAGFVGDEEGFLGLVDVLEIFLGFSSVSETSNKEEPSTLIKHEEGEDRKTMDHDGSEDNAPLPVPKKEVEHGIKRELDDIPDTEGKPKKISRTSISPKKPSSSPAKPARKTRSATSNNTASPAKPSSKEKGSQKITNFFGK